MESSAMNVELWWNETYRCHVPYLTFYDDPAVLSPIMRRDFGHRDQTGALQ